MQFNPNAKPIIKGFFEGVYETPIEFNYGISTYRKPTFPIYGTTNDLPLEFTQVLSDNLEDKYLTITDVIITPDIWFDAFELPRNSASILVNIKVETNMELGCLMKNYESALGQIAPAFYTENNALEITSNGYRTGFTFHKQITDVRTRNDGRNRYVISS